MASPVRPVISWSNRGPWDSLCVANYVALGDAMPAFVWVCTVEDTTDIGVEVLRRKGRKWVKECSMNVPVLYRSTPVLVCSVPLLDLPPGEPAYRVRISHGGRKSYMFDARFRLLDDNE